MINLHSDHENLIKKILKKHVPKKEVWAFGSRVKQTAKSSSDLDLVIISDKRIPSKTMTLLTLNLEESDLPFKVDILDWCQISDEFKKVIQNQYIVFYKKE